MLGVNSLTILAANGAGIVASLLALAMFGYMTYFLVAQLKSRRIWPVGEVKGRRERALTLVTVVWTAVTIFIWPQFVLGFILAFFHDQKGDTSVLLNFFIQLCFHIVQLLVLISLLKAQKKSLRQDLGLDRPKPKIIVDILSVYAVYFIAQIIALTVVSKLFDSFNANQEQITGFEGVSGAGKVLTFFSLVVAAPIVEELVFRGYFYRRLKLVINRYVAAVMVGILFGLVHGQWNVGIDVFILSCASIYLLESTGNLWASIGLHAFKNLIAFVFLFVVKS